MFFLYVLPKCDWFYFLAVKVEIKGKRCVVTNFWEHVPFFCFFSLFLDVTNREFAYYKGEEVKFKRIIVWE